MLVVWLARSAGLVGAAAAAGWDGHARYDVATTLAQAVDLDDLPGRVIREAESTEHPFLVKLMHSSQCVFDRSCRIHTVKVEDV